MNKPNIETTAELLRPNTSKDLWEAIYKECNTEKLLFQFPPNSSFVFRLLGPFVSCRRLYIPSQIFINGYVTKQEFKKLLNKDSDLLFEIMNRVGLDKINTTQRNRYGMMNNYNNVESIGNILDISNFLMSSDSGNPTNSLLSQLARMLASLFTDKFWQKCLLVNALVMNEKSTVYILPINSTTCKELELACEKKASKMRISKKDVKITGYYSHNVKIDRLGKALNTHYKISILGDIPTPLNNEETEYILSNGLIDIKPFIDAQNKKGKNFYYYDIPNEYRMPNAFVNAIFEGVNQLLEDDHFDAIEHNINNLPTNAFDDIEKTNNSMSHLSVDFNV